VESVYRAVRTESLYKTDTIRLETVKAVWHCTVVVVVIIIIIIIITIISSSKSCEVQESSPPSNIATHPNMT
jgi:uncharacterized integral membrane protein